MSYLPYDKYRDVLNYAKKMLAGNPLPFSLPEMTEVEAIVDADERSMIMFERANKLEAELAALKEKYRWHNARLETPAQHKDIEIVAENIIFMGYYDSAKKSYLYFDWFGDDWVAGDINKIQYWRYSDAREVVE